MSWGQRNGQLLSRLCHQCCYLCRWQPQIDTACQNCFRYNWRKRRQYMKINSLYLTGLCLTYVMFPITITALLASETFVYSSATKSAKSVCWRTVFPKDPYLRRRSSTYTSVTSHQLSRWSLDMLMTGPLLHNQRPWEYTVSWYRTPERVLCLLEAVPKRKEDSGDLLSPGQQTGCQKTESDTSGRHACTRLCTKVPRCDSW